MSRICLLLLLPAAACRSISIPSLPPPVIRDTPSQFDLEQSSWKQLGLRDYSFTYTPMCMCAGYGRLYKVEVRDGKVVSFQDGSQPVNLSLRDLPRPTVDSLFAWVKDAYVRKAAVVRVAYHPELHFPTNVSIDWRLSLLDDEFSFEVKDLRPISRVPRH
ncbi:MAG TPA: DUF6174 domain-containing protein [Gemmatimonadaceae bacterium]|nr:DUF6174 domain-containing protein [Gemmatimonadaceae bacterium]